jgi:nitrile hydratase
VRALNRHPAGHTRVPRYARGRCGVVECLHGLHVFPERHAASAPGAPFDEAPQWLYTVRFDGRELWGDDAEPDTSLSIDAWESTLEPAPEVAAVRETSA